MYSPKYKTINDRMDNFHHQKLFHTKHSAWLYSIVHWVDESGFVYI